MSNILLNNQAHTFMLNGKRYVNSFGGGSEPVSPYIDIFSAVQIAYTNGVEILTNTVTDKVGNISCREYSAQYEGFNIAMPHLTVGSTYTVNFDFQYTDADWFVDNYRSGVKIRDTNYMSYDNWTDWEENISRDLLLHNHQMTFTATATTMYLSFNVCGLSDNTNNYFEITNLYLEEVTP